MIYSKSEFRYPKDLAKRANTKQILNSKWGLEHWNLDIKYCLEFRA